jgi:hypothetical protein
VQAILSNNDNQKEVKHGYYNYFQSWWNVCYWQLAR